MVAGRSGHQALPADLGMRGESGKYSSVGQYPLEEERCQQQPNRLHRENRRVGPEKILRAARRAATFWSVIAGFQTVWREEGGCEQPGTQRVLLRLGMDGEGREGSACVSLRWAVDRFGSSAFKRVLVCAWVGIGHKFLVFFFFRKND